jgi:hypothetical protein
MLMCPKHSCQHHATSSPYLSIVKHAGYVSLMWRRYKRFASHFTLASSRPLGSWIFITLVSMSIM